MKKRKGCYDSTLAPEMKTYTVTRYLKEGSYSESSGIKVINRRQQFKYLTKAEAQAKVKDFLANVLTTSVSVHDDEGHIISFKSNVPEWQRQDIIYEIAKAQIDEQTVFRV